MPTKMEIKNNINLVIKEKLFSAIRQIIVEQQKERYVKTSEYNSLEYNKRKEQLNSKYREWYNSISNFYLSYYSIMALHPLVLRELKIREFVSQDVIRIKADYIYNEIEFSSFYPTHYSTSMSKEIEDCISDLKDPRYSHVVDNYKSAKDSERTPKEPLTTAELKFSSFYLFNFEPEYVTKLTNYLYIAGLVTNPETNGWRIDDQIVEDIITVLNSKFDYEKILQYKREFNDKIIDRTTQECIRPTKVNQHYFPKDIDKTQEFNSINFDDESEKADAKKIYEFIFYITLSTQFKNSIYDTSTLEIAVGSKILKEQANVVIEGEENWETLTGKIISRISSNSDNNNRQTVVLPELIQGTILKPLDIYAYSYQSKRPPRFGVGRFITQVLEKNAIGSNKEHDIIIAELIESKAIHKVKTMLHPQENSIILIQWLMEYLPLLLNFEYFRELEDKIELVANNEISIESILNEIDRLIDEAFEESGFVLNDSKPSASKIKLLNGVIKKYNLQIDNSIYDSNIKIDMILAQYPMPEPIKIGSCPSCNSLVFQKEYINPESGESLIYFACENLRKNGGCNFSLWDNYIYKFFSDKSLELFTVEERADALKKILSKKKGYQFNDFVAKNKTTYNARVFPSTYMDKKNQPRWGLSLDFVQKRRSK